MASGGRRGWARIADARLAGGLRIAVVAAVVLAVSLPAASAAGSTVVSLQPPPSDVEADETVTIDLVVETANGGVGGFVADVHLSNPNVGTITDIEFADEPPLSDAILAAEGDAARFGAVLMDTDQTGSVTVASIAVRTEAAGSTDVDLAVETLADENGSVYEIEASGTSLDVAGSGAPAPPPDDGESPDFGDDELDLGGFGSSESTATPTSHPASTPTDSSSPPVATDAPSEPSLPTSGETESSTVEPPLRTTEADGAMPEFTVPSPTPEQIGVGLLFGVFFAGLVALWQRD